MRILVGNQRRLETKSSDVLSALEKDFACSIVYIFLVCDCNDVAVE